MLSASSFDIAWYENLGAGSFGAQRIITTAADSASSVFATDLDGDGDADVLSVSFNDDKIAWYENDGAAGGWTEHVVSTGADLARSVFAADVDGDGDTDVLSASWNDSKIAWYENLAPGNGSSWTLHTISLDANRADGASRTFTQTFTKKYPEIAARNPVYAQLRTLIDLAVVAAYMQEHDAYGKAQWAAETLRDELSATLWVPPGAGLW